ncbi:Palmitoyltransferase [Aphelenchoides fujianensis]|nr:Palmitoyltransferase [Aphelenchoides fujianensis]
MEVKDVYLWVRRVRQKQPILGILLEFCLNALLLGQLLSYAYEWFVYTWIVCGRMLESPLQVAVYLAVYHVLFVLMLASLLRAVITKTSRVPDRFKAPDHVHELLAKCTPQNEKGDFVPDSSNFEQTAEQKWTLDRWAFEAGLHRDVAEVDHWGRLRYCYKCRVLKTDRARHCNSCGFCVPRFDHHCPWLNRCVCHGNYKFFCLFLSYAWFTHFWVLTTTMEGVLRFYLNGDYFRDVWNLVHVGLSAAVQGFFAYNQIGELFTYHVELSLTNETNCEQGKPPVFRSDLTATYNVGMARNLRAVYGWGFWFLPLSTPTDDGVHYPIRYAPNVPEEERFVLRKRQEKSATSSAAKKRTTGDGDAPTDV